MTDFVNRHLVDLRTWDALLPQMVAELSASKLTGIDIETHDDDRHAGLNAFMNVNPKTRKKSPQTPLVFDTRRTTVTGISLYTDGSPNAYYVNLAHADIENRLPWVAVKYLLDLRPDDGWFVAHNAPYELTMLKASLNYDIPRIICTLQLAVTAYGPDEYDPYLLHGANLNTFKPLFREIEQHFLNYTPGTELSSIQQEVLNKVISKQSSAQHSYNGFVKDISYGHGLKKAVKSWFDYDMMSFEKCLGDAAHMGQLTGEQVAYYGCDDAYWCVRLYHRLIQYILDTNPAVIPTFFEQEAPMSQVYSDTYRQGMRIDSNRVKEAEGTERSSYAASLRNLRTALRKACPYDAEARRYIWPCADLHEGMIKYEHDWYPKNTASGGGQMRRKILDWVNLPDHADDFEEAFRVRGPISEPWAKERKKVLSKTALNFVYYRTVRMIMYDLLRIKLRINTKEGKILSDGDARGNVIEKCKTEMKLAPSQADVDRYQVQIDVLNALNALTSCDQRMKLYITPYQELIDPETHRVHPVLSSMLATRRMAAQHPNPMQVSKQGEGNYIRGFYIADDKDEFLISLDWSQIELVTIAELSGDKMMASCYGQLPYKDLHSLAAAQILDLELEEFKYIQRLEDRFTEYQRRNGSVLRFVNQKNEPLTPAKFYKDMRTKLGKVANFEYWYSGALSNTGEVMNWSSEEMWERTEAYRSLFPEAEEWRQYVQSFGSSNGYIELPDHHRRVRFEATQQWRYLMREKWAQLGPAFGNFGVPMVKRIQSRSRNQLVNAMIQGTNATLAKRSVIRINRDLFNTGMIRGRFKQPVHDELLFSIHKDDALNFIRQARRIMCDHPAIFPTLPLNCSVALGKTYQPFQRDTAPVGQFELDEAQECSFLEPEFHGKSLSEAQIRTVMDYMTEAQNQHLRGVLV
jgi:DNA polymerase I-like protein with 3'-5' exonuclease and polymerase domains